MLQQVMTKPGEIIFREVPVPEIKDDEELVKIMNILRLNLLIFLNLLQKFTIQLEICVFIAF